MTPSIYARLCLYFHRPIFIDNNIVAYATVSNVYGVNLKCAKKNMNHARIIIPIQDSRSFPVLLFEKEAATNEFLLLPFQSLRDLFLLKLPKT